MSTSPSEFRYRDNRAETRAWWLLAIAAMLLIGSVITGFWGIAALVRADYLQANDLPSHATSWGIAHLCLATVQGIAGVLILFDRRSGTVLGIAICGLNILAHLAVVSAYPVVSIAAIALNVAVIAALVSFWRR